MTHEKRGVSVAVTGASGRLGSALVQALADHEVHEWSRPDYDLDRAAGAEQLLERDRPSLVFHCAAWTDVDGCARDPGLAYRRNAEAVAELARACVGFGASMVLISTNEVFDGSRTDGLGYTEYDQPAPPNPYGASKLAGELLAAEAFETSDHDARLWIIRTAWLFGPPGNDFPAKIIAASDRLDPAQSLAVVDDEAGSPTYTADLAAAIGRLIDATDGGLYHLVNSGHASRREWANLVLRQCRAGRSTRPISRAEFTRASQAPPWAVLDAGLAGQAGVRLRSWEAAMSDYLSSGC